jgi:hypothetical protein
MAFRTRFTRTVLSTLVVTGALLMGSQPATAEASTDAVLTAGLQAMAQEFGDSVGHLLTTDPAGGTVILAIYRRGYSSYTAGNFVSVDDTLALCHESPFGGGLSSCEILAAPESTGYECDWDENDSWCSCQGFYDCIDMFKTGPCNDGESACYDDGSCVCGA